MTTRDAVHDGETRDRFGVEAPLTAPRIAATMFALMGILLWGVMVASRLNGRSNQEAINALIGLGAFGIAFGLWHKRKWAWWTGVLLSGFYTLLTLMFLPSTLSQLGSFRANFIVSPDALTRWMTFILAASLCGSATMIVALGALLSKSGRRAFSIGREGKTS